MARRPRGLKATLWARMTGHVTVPCAFCPRMLTFAEATVDHEPSLALGGSPRQAVLACDECNQRRGRETNDVVNDRRRAKKSGKHKRGKKK